MLTPSIGILLPSVDHVGRLDAEDFVDRRRDVVDVVELRSRRLVRLDPLRPRDHQRISRAAEMRGDQLGVAERRIAGPGPAGVIHVVGLGGAERVEATDLCRAPRVCCSIVFGIWFCARSSLMRAVLAFGARTVVAEDVEDDRVVAQAQLARVRRSAGRPARRHARRNRRRPPSAGAGTGRCEFGNAVPRRHRVGARRQLGVRRNPSELLSAARRRVRDRRPSRRRTCPCTCPPIP